MPTRYIKESARTSKNLNSVKDFTERLFWRLITTADDFGRFLACPQIVKSACFPLVESMKVFKVEQALKEMKEMKLIILYAIGDRQYGWFVNWQKHQGKPRAISSKYPDVPPDVMDEFLRLQASVGICPQPPTDSHGYPDSDTDTNTDTNTDLNSLSSPDPDLKTPEIMSDFDEVWKAYPRKVGKQDARKAWEKLGKKRPDLVTILHAIAQQTTWPQWTKDDGQYIPHLATWLNQHRWEDEHMTPPPKPPKRPRSLVEML